MTGADLIDRARQALRSAGAVALLLAPTWLTLLVLKPRPGRRWR